MSDSDEASESDEMYFPSENELKEILRKHEAWLESEGRQGERAFLKNADLSRVDLSQADLSQAYLRQADLSGVDFSRADLSKADLRIADLRGANLWRAALSETRFVGANLSEARLSEADLSDANLWGTDLSKVDLWKANLSEANISEADFSGANLLGANLSGTDLSETNLSKAYLSKAKLSGANLSEANLSGADLSEADLSGVDLRKADLSEARLSEAKLTEANLWGTDLSGADISGVDLSGANLSGANLSKTYLSKANLSGADLTGANIREARLRDADLSDTDGLQVQAIAQADTSNATLPDDVAQFDGLKTIEEATRGARKLLISLGLACAYAALAVSTVRPEASGEEVLTLPFIEVNISPWGFHLAVPILLAVGFSYLHLQLQRVWEEISRLPAVFPDGKAIDQKIHPWLITGLVRAHFPYLRENPIPLFRVQEVVVIALAWGTVPATQAYFVGSFVAQFPDYVYLSGLGAVLVFLTTIGAVVSYQTAKAHLRGDYEGLFRPFSDEEDESIRKHPNWHTVFLSIEWTLLIFALWIGWTFVL
jgi:uncharacterized protein YjbI with pentapeptide repeats